MGVLWEVSTDCSDPQGRVPLLVESPRKKFINLLVSIPQELASSGRITRLRAQLADSRRPERTERGVQLVLDFSACRISISPYPEMINHLGSGDITTGLRIVEFIGP